MRVWKFYISMISCCFLVCVCVFVTFLFCFRIYRGDVALIEKCLFCVLVSYEAYFFLILILFPPPPFLTTPPLPHRPLRTRMPYLSFSSQLTPEMSTVQADWSQARVAAAAPLDPSRAPLVTATTTTTTTTATRGSSNATTPTSGGDGMSGSGRPGSASSAFSATGTGGGSVGGGGGGGGKVTALRLSAAELASQLQAESSPSPRMPTTPASGTMPR